MRILGKVRFELKMWVLRGDCVRGRLQKGFDREGGQGGSRSLDPWADGVFGRL